MVGSAVGVKPLSLIWACAEFEGMYHESNTVIVDDTLDVCRANPMHLIQCSRALGLWKKSPVWMEKRRFSWYFHQFPWYFHGFHFRNRCETGSRWAVQCFGKA